MMCKKVGPKNWRKYLRIDLATSISANTTLVPFLAFSFGLITTCMSVMTGYHGFIAARVLLGVFEAGIMPGITYTLSC